MVVRKSIFTQILLGISLLQISACSSFGYLLHTSSGHLQMMSQRQSIQSLIESEATDADDKKALAEVLQIRKFASEKLLLPDNKSYTSYVNLERDYVTWIVFAAQPLSLDAKNWCFWIVGCVPYRGYFDYDKAVDFSIQLRQQGYETYLAPVPAYSTLGWFSDPVLSSMLNRGRVVTAEYIFHELAHQQLYIKNDASFNEAFATAVGQLGTSYWLADNGKQDTLQRYLKANQHKQEIYRIVSDLRMQLQKIYQSAIDDNSKQDLKQQALTGYQQLMAEQLEAWNRYDQYKDWLLNDINNAKLNAFSTYRDLVPLFVDLYERCNKKFDKFYHAVESMRAVEQQQRVKQLASMQC